MRLQKVAVGVSRDCLTYRFPLVHKVYTFRFYLDLVLDLVGLVYDVIKFGWLASMADVTFIEVDASSSSGQAVSDYTNRQGQRKHFRGVLCVCGADSNPGSGRYPGWARI